jgi:hypothetical protein
MSGASTQSTIVACPRCVLHEFWVVRQLGVSQLVAPFLDRFEAHYEQRMKNGTLRKFTGRWHQAMAGQYFTLGRAGPSERV